MRILLADDDILVLQGLKNIIEAEGRNSKNPKLIIAQAQDGNEAVELYKKSQPDIALMDIRMPNKNGIEAGREILQIDPVAKIIYLSTFREDEYIIEALRIGAKGYLIKSNFESITPALDAVQSGQNVFGDEIISKMPKLINSLSNESDKNKLDDSNLRRQISELSEQELRIINLVANGLSNKEIALELFLSEGTCRNYISTILEKLELRDRTQLAIFYYKYLK